MNGYEFKQSRRLALKIISAAIVGLIATLISRFTKFLEPRKRKKQISSTALKKDVTVDADVFIVKQEEGRWEVFSRTCPHLGCKIKYEQQGERFVCPCHGSQFTLQGRYVRGPAKKDLTRLPYQIKEKQLIISL